MTLRADDIVNGMSQKLCGRQAGMAGEGEISVRRRGRRDWWICLSAGSERDGAYMNT